MYALNLAADGRVLSATKPEYAPPGAVMVDALPEGDLAQYRYSLGSLIHDTALAAEAEQQAAAEQARALTAELRETDAAVLEALEDLLSCTTLDGFLAAMLSAAGALKETLAARRDLRERIEEIKEG